MDPKQTDVVLTYRNFAGQQGISHRGLSIAATNNCKTLLQNGINARVQPLADANDFRRFLANNPSATHIVISALWLKPLDIEWAADQYPRCQFVVVCHSNVGFLQTDPGAITMLRDLMASESLRWNVHVAGNSRPFCDWIIKGYGAPCTYLPNLYYMDPTSAPQRPVWRGGDLNVGLFGASRWQKNFISAVAAATMAANQLKAKVNLMVNSGRRDGPDAEKIYNAAMNMVRGLPYISLEAIPWAPWPVFRQYVKTRHVLLQPSYSESFNYVTGDGIAMGVPSVVSPAINWVPEDWQVDPDDTDLIANKIMTLATDTSAAERGFKALMRHNSHGLDAWLQFILTGRFGTGADPWTSAGMPKNAIVGYQSLDYHRAA